MSDFHFMFYVLHLTLRTSSKFLKILYNSDVYRLSLTLHWLLSKLKRPLNGNANNSENLLNGVFGMFILWNSKKYVFTCLCENNNFFNSTKENIPTYCAKIAETPCFNYAFLLSDPVGAVIRRYSSKSVFFCLILSL